MTDLVQSWAFCFSEVHKQWSLSVDTRISPDHGVVWPILPPSFILIMLIEFPMIFDLGGAKVSQEVLRSPRGHPNSTWLAVWARWSSATCYLILPPELSGSESHLRHTWWFWAAGWDAGGQIQGPSSGKMWTPAFELSLDPMISHAFPTWEMREECFIRRPKLKMFIRREERNIP